MVNMIIQLLMLSLLTVLCLVAGISDFKKIYPTRYGKKHIELEGKVVGEDRVITRGGSSKCPVLEFFYQDKRYEIADTTYLLFYHNLKLGDVMTVCFNPDAYENVVIIKRGKYNFETFAWFYMLVLGLFCLAATIIGIIWLCI
ncbi:MAG: hypothetical protein NC124_05690 [Clostridium sp.]|nr:hypothetical protein [Clostridium sp.]